MSIFASRKPATAANNNSQKADTTERKSSEFWLNIGYSVEYTDAEGNAAKAFIALNKGIPLDDIEMLDESRSGNFGAMNQAANVLLSEIRSAAAEMAPGEDRIIGGDPGSLEVQLRRVRDKTVASTDPTKNVFIRR